MLGLKKLVKIPPFHQQASNALPFTSASSRTCSVFLPSTSLLVQAKNFAQVFHLPDDGHKQVISRKPSFYLLVGTSKSSRACIPSTLSLIQAKIARKPSFCLIWLCLSRIVAKNVRKPYQKYVRQLSGKWPHFRLLLDFMEVGTSPMRWPKGQIGSEVLIEGNSPVKAGNGMD